MKWKTKELSIKTFLRPSKPRPLH